MHTAALPQILTTGPVRATGIAAWAIRSGRALEHWGRTRAARRAYLRAEASAHLRATHAVRVAVAERDALHRSAAIPLR
ncbi:hypothetical protein [Agromyces silvae]|uniref:hypothetical protein n=1 Tax=Agromyces silvae TaxID=3388266 RepID=UPI00280B3058|nr:hypothetical protein [Agromyces protaetiae]